MIFVIFILFYFFNSYLNYIGTYIIFNNKIISKILDTHNLMNYIPIVL